MWKRQEKPVSNPVSPANPFREGTAGSSMAQSVDIREGIAQEKTKAPIAHIGKSVQVKGELSGSEDLLIDGQVEGTIELLDHHLTVGTSGNVNANVNAKKVIILGSVKGNIRATESVDVRKSGSLMGDLVVAGVSIEDGAYFKGSIDIQKAGKPAVKPSEPRRATSPALSS